MSLKKIIVTGLVAAGLIVAGYNLHPDTKVDTPKIDRAYTVASIIKNSQKTKVFDIEDRKVYSIAKHKNPKSEDVKQFSGTTLVAYYDYKPQGISKNDFLALQWVDKQTKYYSWREHYKGVNTWHGKTTKLQKVKLGEPDIDLEINVKKNSIYYTYFEKDFKARSVKYDKEKIETRNLDKKGHEQLMNCFMQYLNRIN
ncbi:MAG: hypothetical protein U9R08_05940 [Nanoarchaeota archaeon]|nr:hypothetical protein [Nanoarchaeota archaeon]